MSDPLKWITTNGGPMVLVPRSALSAWRGDRGTSGPKVEDFTDYGRACQVEGFLGLIECDGRHVPVIGDEPAETTWLPYHFSSGIIAKWTYAPSRESASAALARLALAEVIDGLTWRGPKVFAEIADQSMWLFDAALEGRDLKPGRFIEIPAHPGTLEIDTAIYEPNPDLSFVLHSVGTRG
jgi:hypothetical protein